MGVLSGRQTSLYLRREIFVNKSPAPVTEELKKEQGHWEDRHPD